MSLRNVVRAGGGIVYPPMQANALRQRNAPYYPYEEGLLTFTGDLITDAVRALGQAATFTDFLPIPGGVGIWPAYTNKTVQSVPGAAADTNVTVGGDVGAVLSKVVDATAPVANASGEVWEFDNSAGATDATADFAGATGATTAHSISIAAKITAGSGASIMLGTAGVGSTPVVITATGWPGEVGTDNRTKSQNITPANTDVLRVTVPAGCVVRFVAPQLQTGVIVTPWVRTTGASAGTTAGRVQLPVSGLFTETQGWVATRIDMDWGVSSEPGGFPVVWDWRDDANNLLQIVYFASDNTFNAYRGTGGTTSAAAVTTTHEAGDSISLVHAWNATQTRISEDGAAFVNAANTLIPTLTATSATVGSGSTGNQVSSNVLWLATGSGTLTDADAAALNAFGDTPPTVRELYGAFSHPASARPTALWDAVTATFKRFP